MKKFFEWLFKAFSPDKSKYVKNMSVNTPATSSDSVVSGRKRKADSPVLAWIPRVKILENQEDNQGMTTDLILKSGASFVEIEVGQQIKVTSKKKGLSAVEHEVIFKENSAPTNLIEQAAREAGITFLYRNDDGELLILGEGEGLKMTHREDGSVVFSGQEKDVFYRVSEECFKKLMPNID